MNKNITFGAKLLTEQGRTGKCCGIRPQPSPNWAKKWVTVSTCHRQEERPRVEAKWELTRIHIDKRLPKKEWVKCLRKSKSLCSKWFMSHFKITLETNPMICRCNKYPYQNTLEYKTNKRVGFQNNFKMRHDESLVLEYLNDEEQ